MALIADDAADRAEQLLALTQRLRALIAAEADAMRARLPLPDGPALEEKQRLVNAYRLEMTRIAQDNALIATAPASTLNALRAATQSLQDALGRHDAELSAVRAISEGLVEAMAEDIARQESARAGYGAKGGPAASQRAPAVVVNKTA